MRKLGLCVLCVACASNELNVESKGSSYDYACLSLSEDNLAQFKLYAKQTKRTDKLMRQSTDAYIKSGRGLEYVESLLELGGRINQEALSNDDVRNLHEDYGRFSDFKDALEGDEVTDTFRYVVSHSDNFKKKATDGKPRFFALLKTMSIKHFVAMVEANPDIQLHELLDKVLDLFLEDNIFLPMSQFCSLLGATESGVTYLETLILKKDKPAPAIASYIQEAKERSMDVGIISEDLQKRIGRFDVDGDLNYESLLPYFSIVTNEEYSQISKTKQLKVLYSSRLFEHSCYGLFKYALDGSISTLLDVLDDIVENKDLDYLKFLKSTAYDLLSSITLSKHSDHILRLMLVSELRVEFINEWLRDGKTGFKNPVDDMQNNILSYSLLQKRDAKLFAAIMREI